MHHTCVIFPFTAIVNQERMKKALILNTIDPSIGGVLIRGDKGTGKSTAVRALANLLPKMDVVSDCPFHCHPSNLKRMCKSCQERFERGETLPVTKQSMQIVDMALSSTEDMVVGTLDIQKVLKEGIKALEPGILAKANRNILYIDEVNLLDNHLVNILLDAAAMGVNIIEREGVSMHHPARFILVGTMNPEEGELRPQLLDRFGLCVDVEALADKEARLNVMAHRKAFDDDPWKFEERFKAQQSALKDALVTAQALLPSVAMSDDMAEKIVEITISLAIKTHRADIVMKKTAIALAALDGRDHVTEDDIIEAALLALPHRMKARPFEPTREVTMETIQQALAQDVQDDAVFEREHATTIQKNVLTLDDAGTKAGNDSFESPGSRGKYVRAQESAAPKSIALDASVRKAIRQTGATTILPEHVMEKVRVTQGDALYIMLLDSSSSMGMERKVRFAKSLFWLLLTKFYEKKTRAALFVFRNTDASLLVPPTADYEKIKDALDMVPTGGKTPLTPALFTACALAKKETQAKPVIILVSDGRGNVFANETLERDLAQLEQLKNDRIGMIIVNSESKNRSAGVLESMAARFNAAHYYLEEVL